MVKEGITGGGAVVAGLLLSRVVAAGEVAVAVFLSDVDVLPLFDATCEVSNVDVTPLFGAIGEISDDPEFSSPDGDTASADAVSPLFSMGSGAVRQLQERTHSNAKKPERTRFILSSPTPFQPVSYDTGQ